MQPNKRSYLLILVLVQCLIGLTGLTTACSPIQARDVPVVEASSRVDVPAAVTTAHAAVLKFLRSDANCTVPPDGVRWDTAVGRAPAGFAVYILRAEQCLVTVSYPLSADTPSYHVGLTNQELGFCWQANVNAQGKVVNTGSTAELMPDLTDAAATFCEEAGYAYSIKEQPDGTRCGVCTFPNGSHCKAWLYYQDVCEPAKS
jgi:putative hemolysin